MSSRRALAATLMLGVAATTGGWPLAAPPAAAAANPTFQLVGFYDEQGTKVDRLEQGKVVHAEFSVVNANAFNITFTELAPAVTATTAGCAGSLKVAKPVDLKGTVAPASATSEPIKDTGYTLSGPCQATELGFAVNKYWWASYNGPVPARSSDGAKSAAASSSPTPPPKPSASQILPPEPDQRQRVTQQAQPAQQEPQSPSLPPWMIGILACAGVLVVAGVVLYLIVQFEDLRRRR